MLPGDPTGVGKYLSSKPWDLKLDIYGIFILKIISRYLPVG